jgi:hypothetical protein
MKCFNPFTQYYMRRFSSKWLAFAALLPALLAGGRAAAQQPTVQGDIAPGEVRFFGHAPNPRFASAFGAVTDFANGDEVHAALVPLTGMRGLPQGQNAYIVRLSVDGAYRAEVEVELPPQGPYQRILAFPVLPRHDGDRLPRLAAAMQGLLQGARGRHRYTVEVLLKQDRLYLASGEFTADGYMGLRQLEALEVQVRPTAAMQDSAVRAFVGQELDRDYPHLGLVRVETLEPWHEEPTLVGPVQSSTIRYTVQARHGGCYQGTSKISRNIRKNKGPGRVLGDLWPNVAVPCE